jgi:predicted metal-dependent hydrolase
VNLQLDLLFQPIRPAVRHQHLLTVGSRTVPIHFIRSRRARRYIIRLRSDGSVRATVPSRGSIKEAKAFAERKIDWISKQLQKQRQQPVRPQVWQHGTEILYRGKPLQLHIAHDHNGGILTFGDQSIRGINTADVRLTVERHLWRLAAKELSQRTIALARLHNITIRCVTVRNQRSRWGSCSRKGTISLNWRLIQTPEFVRDYIILHELMHCREMNHSKHFWKEVATVCREYQKAESWLKQHRQLLR